MTSVAERLLFDDSRIARRIGLNSHLLTVNTSSMVSLGNATIIILSPNAMVGDFRSLSRAVRLPVDNIPTYYEPWQSVRLHQISAASNYR